jgi:predicted anti-sigma-YlaC factor YlaD
MATLAPDHALTEIEERMLSRHLERCSSCSGFAASVAEFTTELRAAPAAVPAIRFSPVLARPRRGTRMTMRTPLVALASTAAGILIAFVMLQEGSVPRGASRPQPPVLIQAAPDNERAVLRQFRDLALARIVNQEPPRGQPGMYVG